ncbi:MAG TPA: hypothetical protein VHT73_17875 [Thermodesulfobacteriota bacterium]|nr:hypothetical protein [Thermodesulfobacteriota bacterium]
MKVKVKKGSTVQTKDGKTHKEGEVLEVGKDISKEEYESQKAKFEQEEKKDPTFDKAFKDKPDKK